MGPARSGRAWQWAQAPFTLPLEPVLNPCVYLPSSGRHTQSVSRAPLIVLKKQKAEGLIHVDTAQRRVCGGSLGRQSCGSWTGDVGLGPDLWQMQSLSCLDFMGCEWAMRVPVVVSTAAPPSLGVRGSPEMTAGHSGALKGPVLSKVKKLSWWENSPG